MDWYIKRLQPQDRDAYLNIWRQVWEKVSAHQYFKWLYQDNPHGQALTWVAINQETKEIIGSTSLFPRKIWCNNKIILGALGGDAFVDPKFRKRGIASELHNVSVKEMGKAGIKILYGFPNMVNIGPLTRGGWQYIGNFNRMKLQKSKFLRETDRKNKIKKITKFDARFDKLIEKVLPSHSICCFRDSAYLEWRHFEDPRDLTPTVFIYEEDGEIQGFAVVKLLGDKCYLQDFFTINNENAAGKIINGLFKFADSKRSDLILSTINPLGLYNNHFLKHRRKPVFIHRRIPLLIYVRDGDCDLEFFNNLKNWYLTPGDRDW